MKAEKPVPEIAAEVKILCDAVHELLRGPDGHGQLDHSYETQRIVLDIPKAWVVMASWLAIKERQRRDNTHVRSAFMRRSDPAYAGRHVRTWARGHLWRLIHDVMHAELHELAIGVHPYLYAPPEKKERPAGDMDDGFPF